MIYYVVKIFEKSFNEVNIKMKRIAAGVLCALMTLSFAACDKMDFYKPEPTDPDMSGVPIATVNDIIVVGDTAYEPYYFRQ